MTPLLLISSCFIALLGGAMLTLARMEPGHAHIRDWGWSQILLALTLTLGIALLPTDIRSLHYQLQATAATACMIGALAMELAGAAHYVGRPWHWRRYAPLSAILLVVVLGTALLNQAAAIWLASVVLACGAWLAARWMWRSGGGAERFVAGCFTVSGLLHFLSPLEDPHARSVVAHIAGTCVQGVLAMALILLSVRRAQREAARVGGQLRLLYEQSMQGLMVIRDRRVLYANPAALAIFGFERAEDIGAMAEQLPAADLEASRARYRQLMEAHAGHIGWEGERYRRDGSPIYLRGSSSYVEWEGGPAMLVLMLDDTARQRANDALRRQALHDELTDLPNRHAALARLAELTAPGRTEGFALLSADLDRFQLVNESLGHEVGDALLQAIAARLRAALPADALLARLGEDQFLLLQPGKDGEMDDTAARRVGERLLSLMAAPFEVGRHQLYVHMSVGVAHFPAHGQDGAALLRAADVAMHRAKQQAGAAVVGFEPAMTARSGALLEIEQTLAAAIEAEEFVLEYQPKFAAGTRRLTGFEALVRWQRPGHGRVSPAEFIPAAERTGQIGALGMLIVRQAARQLRAWRQLHGRVLPVAINASPLQFEDPQFAHHLLALLQAHGVAASDVEVEVTETAAIAPLERVLPQLQQLREAGVGVGLDDFGTGQSSLTLLGRLPITTLKLDRSMIDPLPDPTAAAVVHASCVLARALGMAVVAEGVETEAQAGGAEAQGCTHLQGYLLARPMAADLAGALLAEPLSTPSAHPFGSSRPAATPG